MRTGFFWGTVALLAGMAYANAANPNPATEQPPRSSNGLLNLSARFRPNSTSFDLFADLLVWCAAESGTNWAEVIIPNSSGASCDMRSIGSFDWNAGFRVGLGYGMRHDQWDTQFYYTWFRTTADDHVSSSPGTVYSSLDGNFYVDNPNGSGIAGIAYQKASNHWTIRFNMFDWELGRSFWVSQALSLRPFIGLKGGWVDQSIHTKWYNPQLTGFFAGSPPFSVGRENIKNNFWGIGPSGGLNTKWNLLARQNHSLNLFGDISGAIMWGHWSFGDVYKNDIQQKVSIDLSNVSRGASMLRTLMGLGWDANFSCNRFHYSVKLGYEMQFWFDQLQFYSFGNGRLNNELTLQGGTLELRFDF